MPPETDRHLVIARLREEIRRIERSPARREGCLACGLAGVDAVLPGGGFPRGALTELSGGPASGKTAVALALVAALGAEELAAYVDGRGELYPPAAAARGVDLARLLVVRPPAEAPRARAARSSDVRPGLWAAEALLGSGAFAAVIVDLPVPAGLPGADAVARRLQAAAERGGAVGLWLAPGKGLRLPGAIRIEIAAEDLGPAPGPSDGRRIVGRALRGAAPRGGGRTHRAA
jgi:protein ImuA